MAAKRKNQSLLNAGAFMVWFVRTIQISLGGIKDAELRASFVKIFCA